MAFSPGLTEDIYISILICLLEVFFTCADTLLHSIKLITKTVLEVFFSQASAYTTQNTQHFIVIVKANSS